MYATSVDYDPSAEETVGFFKIVQNKVHYAAHGHTAAEVIAARADAGHAFAKKTQATPERDLKLARRRMKEVRDG